MLMQIIVTSKTNEPIHFRDILLREVFGKWGMTVSVPIFLGMTWTGNRWLPTVSTILIMIPVILLCIIYFIITKHAWYEDLAGLTVTRNLSLQKIKTGFYALIIVTVTGAGTSLIEFLVRDRVPCRMAAFQNNNSTKPYVDFLKKQQTNPVDYVIGLFDKYDVVVLCKTAHPEMTQWDFIYDIIRDPRFIHSMRRKGFFLITQHGDVHAYDMTSIGALASGASWPTRPSPISSMKPISTAFTSRAKTPACSSSTWTKQPAGRDFQIPLRCRGGQILCGDRGQTHCQPAQNRPGKGSGRGNGPFRAQRRRNCAAFPKKEERVKPDMRSTGIP